MTFMHETGALLKRDRRGRVLVPRERQEALLDEFERSGLSGTKFAALCGVKYPSFAGWVQRRRKERASGPRAAVEDAGEGAVLNWLEAVAETPAAMQGPVGIESAALTVHLPGGAQVEIACHAQALLAAKLLRALAAAAPGGARSC